MKEGEKSGIGAHWPAVAAASAAVLTAIGTLIGGLAAAGVIGNDGSAPGPVPTIDTTTQTETAPNQLPFEPTENELRLAALVPVAQHVHCERADSLQVRTIAGFYCTPPGAGGLAYYLFERNSDVNAHMKDRLSFGDPEGRCGKAASGSSTFNDQEGEEVGSVVCYLRQGQAWIEWSNLQATVYAYAFRDDGDWEALFDFWRNAGPQV